ncbi:unnamed protein product, partial [Sphenostylis stenocarpa]
MADEKKNKGHNKNLESKLVAKGTNDSGDSSSKWRDIQRRQQQQVEQHTKPTTAEVGATTTVSGVMAAAGGATNTGNDIRSRDKENGELYYG